MALKDERSPKYAFPGAGTSLLKSPRKSLLTTFLGFSMLATGSCCCCCCAHKDTAPPGWGNTMALKDERSPKYAFPGAGTSLLKSPRKSLLYVYVSRCWLLGAAAAAAAVAAAAAAGAADPSKRRFPCCCCCAHKDTLYVSGCWLAASCCTAAVALTDASACVCLCLLLPMMPAAALLAAAACCCLLLPAAACCSLLLCPQRHGPPGWGNTMALKDERSPK